jgi:glycosyltransferase involved in cell wall biosynthesis
VDSPLTVVQVTGRLGIGGVESHVSRLAAGLIDRGHRVILVTQESGVHGEQAQATGAELLIVPFGNDGLRSASEELAGRSIDIVHAHNYRAARFGAPLARALSAPYIMTVHGPRPWYKRVTFRDWSNTVLTVSEADRNNILGPFGVSADRTVVGFLGVDTERFTSGLDSSSLRAEWGVPNDQPLVLNVSRFTHRKARPALALIEALPIVRRRVSNTTLVLLGEGDQLGTISAAASRLNRTIGKRVVVLSGPRTDIPQVMNAGDVVVATATTAIESLACATPTVAFGRTGYFGIVTPENFEAARAVCFGDHGRLPTEHTAERLVEDLTSLLADLPAARRSAERVRTTIAQSYSTDRMVEHIATVYRQLIAAHSKHD